LIPVLQDGSPKAPSAGVWARRALGTGLLVTALGGSAEAQRPPVPVTVDSRGVMRWTANGRDVALWGVNYTTPFAHAYRAHGYLGADRRQAIDTDVLHFARLGLDAYRIHVWDREVSDRQGNLVANDHLDLLDYLVSRLAGHGIKVILTPIAWWPTGYPEPDPATDGLSDGFRNKGEMTARSDGWPAQENYLRQFVRHRNPYTGLTYADDPTLIALEIFNEPNHPAGPAVTTRYIDTLAKALRDAGFRKPVFYNISEGYSDAHGHAVCAARIDGVTHQWYPTGLVRNGAVGGNMLPSVDRYTIPYDGFPECRNKARMVYEFDAADVGASYMYPAMARAFRGAGFQWATQFAYDPLAMAHANTEYQTHFLNLVYTPSKAISFMIAGAVFRMTPRGASFGRYPASERFGPFRVSYAEDLSEMVADTVFLYSNDTRTAPPAPAGLRHVAGVGSSPVVEYGGTGAYFLDRMQDGVWRLEVYPDVVWVVDPFTRPSLTREAARVMWRTRPMRITLPDLGDDFRMVAALDSGASRPSSARSGAFDVRPGRYALIRRTTEPDAVAASLPTFSAPPPSNAPTTVLHQPPAEVEAGRPFTVRVEVVSREPPDSVTLFVRRVGWGCMMRVTMSPAGAFGYQAGVPAETMAQGLLEYAVTVYQADTVRTFPGNERGDPSRWDFTGRTFWRVPVVAAEAPVLLFDARRDRGHVLYPHPWSYVRFRTDLTAGGEPGALALSAVVEDFSPEPHHFALRTFLPPGERTRLDALEGSGSLRIRARSAGGRAADRVQVALVERDGSAWGAVIDLTAEWREIVVPLSELRPVPLALLPRPYPQFLPYLMAPGAGAGGPRPAELDGLQFAIAPDLLPADAREGAHGFEVERVVVDRRSR
ncbi:MAG TPA: hypothetical protein VFH97_01630, partial [Gemmatimonadales bacterium]|nr:hypothetical protein [Gemmatimonadales bacterium]